jgi:hypothetical protein
MTVGRAVFRIEPWPLVRSASWDGIAIKANERQDSYQGKHSSQIHKLRESKGRSPQGNSLLAGPSESAALHGLDKRARAMIWNFIWCVLCSLEGKWCTRLEFVDCKVLKLWGLHRVALLESLYLSWNDSWIFLAIDSSRLGRYRRSPCWVETGVETTARQKIIAVFGRLHTVPWIITSQYHS